MLWVVDENVVQGAFNVCLFLKEACVVSKWELSKEMFVIVLNFIFILILKLQNLSYVGLSNYIL